MVGFSINGDSKLSKDPLAFISEVIAFKNKTDSTIQKQLGNQIKF